MLLLLLLLNEGPLQELVIFSLFFRYFFPLDIIFVTGAVTLARPEIFVGKIK